MSSINHLLGKIYQGDCLPFMRSLPDKCVDLIVTDSPYKAHFKKGGGAFGQRQYFDDVANGVGSNEDFEIKIFLPEMLRIMKKFNAYFWTSQKLIYDYLDFAIQNGFHYDLLFWGKTNPLPTKNNKYLPDVEYCVFMREIGAYFNNNQPFEYYKKFFISPINKSEYGHPTEKPLNAILPSIAISCPLNGIVFDPFAGSYTTGVASERLGFKHFGCEILPIYCEIAQKRIDIERAQPKLF